MTTRTGVRGATLALWGLLVVATGRVSAQTTTGTIRGTVSDPAGTGIGGATLQARNTGTGVVRSTTSGADGSYVLTGLAPGAYELSARRIGVAPQTHAVRVLVGATALENFTLTQQAVALEAVVVTGAAPSREMQTSEIATNVAEEQIEALPTADRNFLGLVNLAPGALYTSEGLPGDRIDGQRRVFSTGAQGPNQINVFVDGASYKNDLLQGGVAGQDASRGNPFPRNAVQEFRVITQNYKAEYQKASGGVITAVTRSGGSTWTGSAFFSGVGEGLIALDTFAIADQATNPTTFQERKYSRVQFGASAGGPIMPSRLHFFGSLEIDRQNRTTRVDIVPPSGTPALNAVNFAQYNGVFGSPFRGTLGFGKLSYYAGERSTFDLSYSHRHEYDIRDFGGLTAFTASTRFKNDVSTAALRYHYARGALLNEATVSYQRYRYNPVPNQPGQVNRFYGFGCCAQIGSNVSVQDFTQTRLAVRNDVTYTGIELAGSHVVKVGVSADFLDYDILKRNSENPRFVYEPWFNNFSIPEHVEFQAGDPNFGANNVQVGAFLQDDWSPVPRLVVNAGLRWDFETNEINYDYVTPRAIVDSLTKYQSRLFVPLDPARYFTDGDDRPRFLGAFQPRVGFSLQVDPAGRTTVFGGWGVFYDRNIFDMAIEEKFALQHPSYRVAFRPVGDTDPNRIDWNDSYLLDGQQTVQTLLATAAANTPEVKLLPNDIRPPRSSQFSAGVRQAIGTFAVQAAYTGVRSSNTFTFYFANMNFTCPERSFGVAGCFVVNSIPGYSTILLGDNRGKTWYDALQVQVERPYRRSGDDGWGWGGGLSYALAERETEGFNDLFSFPNPADYPRQVRNDERHRLVANWILDLPYAGGVQFSGLVIIGSGVKADVGDRFGGPSNPFEPGGFDAPTFKMVDLRLRKSIPLYRGHALAVTADLFNAFNFQNLGDFNTFSRTDQNFGNARRTISDPRRLQIGAEYGF